MWQTSLGFEACVAYVLEEAPRLFALKAAPQSKWVAAVVRSPSHRPPIASTAASATSLACGARWVLQMVRLVNRRERLPYCKRLGA